MSLSFNLLRDFGLQINLAKSHLIPSQEVKFIGTAINTLVFRAFLPQDRERTLVQMATRVRLAGRIPEQQLLQLSCLPVSECAPFNFGSCRHSNHNKSPSEQFSPVH